MKRDGEPEQVTLPDTTDTAPPNVPLPDTFVSRDDTPISPFDDEGAACDEAPGRYEPIAGELGHGGMGRVVAVVDHFVGRVVAMKQLLNELTSNPSVGTHATAKLEQRFLREARLTGQLEHPAIVPVYEIGRRKDGSLYYTMTRLRGPTLAEALHGAGGLDARLLLMPNVLTVCQAIAHAHERGVINRDIKPQNVMLGRFGVTYVLDWGLARAKNEAEADVRLAPTLTQGVSPVGTPSYMSPEQASAQVELIDERSDVWGLGATLYEVLTGQPPYSGHSPWDVIADVKTKPWVPVRQLEPRAPADLVAICEKALNKDRAQRYPNAGAMVSDLESWLQGRRVGAYEYTSVELLQRFVKRQRQVLGVGLAAALALLAVGAVSYARIREERNATRQFAQLLAGDLGSKLDAVPGARDAVGQMWERVIDFYVRQPPVTPEEQDAVVLAWLRLGELQQNAGQLVEARRTLTRCAELAPLEPLPVRLGLATTAVSCRLDLAQLESLEGHAEASRVAYSRLWATLAPLEERFELAQWKASLASVGARVADAANLAGQLDEAAEVAARALALQERALSLAPDDPAVRQQTVMALQAMEVNDFSFDHPQSALAHGARAISLARPLAQPNNFDAQRSLGSLLRQHGMLLSWFDASADEAHALLVEATSHLERALTLDPGDLSTMGELGDTWLELEEPGKALAVLSRANTLGVKGEYALSLGFAQLLARDLPAAKETFEQGDPTRQGLVCLAVIAALSERPHDAADLLRKSQERSEEPLQWPRGAIGRLARPQRNPSARVLEAFTVDYERAFVANDRPGMQQAFETAIAGFDALPAHR
jgi:tetratricopeptide (TPR) repeat protein